MRSQHRWIRAGFVLFVVGALGLTGAALGDFSRVTDAVPPQPTCGCGRPDSSAGAQVAATRDIGGSGGDVTSPLIAQERVPDGTVVEWVTLIGEAFVGAYPGAMYVFTGGSEATASAGNCGSGPRQRVVIIIPGEGDLGSKQDVIVTRVGDQTANISEIAPGTRVGSIQVLGSCGLSGEYQGWRGVVE
jgi:hypothetical protein